MAVRKMVAVFTLCALLIVAATPRRAYAIDTAWIVLGSMGAYLIFVGLGTWLVTSRMESPDDTLMPDYRLPLDERHETTVHIGRDCVRRDESLPLICW